MPIAFHIKCGGKRNILSSYEDLVIWLRNNRDSKQKLREYIYDGDRFRLIFEKEEYLGYLSIQGKSAHYFFLELFQSAFGGFAQS